MRRGSERAEGLSLRKDELRPFQRDTRERSPIDPDNVSRTGTKAVIRSFRVRAGRWICFGSG